MFNKQYQDWTFYHIKFLIANFLLVININEKNPLYRHDSFYIYYIKNWTL